MIPVTKPFIPPLSMYMKYLAEIWQREWLTNNGPILLDLEEKLKQHLQIRNLLYVGNGTIALQLAIKALGLKGEIITTPFSFVATTSCIAWEGLTPVFVDIDANTFNIDANKIEAAITPNTSAILATHCFGNACDIGRIQQIAQKYNLKVIYDSAHCFGTSYKGKSIFNYGDISTTSFHATKLFHTVEGGAVFANDEEVLKRLKLMRNFGHDGPEKFNGIGINGKNSEVHAAMGLCVLKSIDEISKKRNEQSVLYDDLLKEKELQHIVIQKDCKFNFAYYPVVFKSEEELLKVKGILENNEISPRRYFYPALSSLHYLERKIRTPIADSIAKRILCLPLYHTLENSEIEKICNLIITHK